ncbi:MAG: GDP-L-fucose synthase [Tannerellaceae bacterium]|nr:GDP-L-fucose synthase [Tannerellaceae bacterium]
MNKKSKIYIAGHTGLVGSAILKKLQNKGYDNFTLRTHRDLDLSNQAAVDNFFAIEHPEYVFLSAAYVGGIIANYTYRADYIYINILIQTHVISSAWKHGVKKLLFLGSTCIYPKETPQPMREEYLLTSPLEYTNEPYAIAKIAGLKMCESFNLQYGTNFIAIMPTNLYGPNDNFNLATSHVLPAIMRKIHLAKCLMENDWNLLRKDFNTRPINGISGDASETEIRSILEKHGITAKEVTLWGTGRPMREFLWSEDLADASIFIMENVDFSDLKQGYKEIRNTHINIGTGNEISIKELATLVKDTIQFNGNLQFDASKPDGTIRKLTDVSKLHKMGWHHAIEIDKGVNYLYNWYINSII